MDIPFWTIGGTIDLANLRPEDMTAEAIGNTLSNINRFNGRSYRPYSVAAHSVLVELLCPPELGPWALLHDAHEAFIGDITNPALDYICSCGTGTAVRNAVYNAKGALDRRIGAAWGVSVQSLNATLRRFDNIALRAEAYVLLGTPHEFTDDQDVADFCMAVALMAQLPVHHHSAAKLWISQVQSHARHGRMTPPVATVPACAVQAG